MAKKTANAFIRPLWPSAWHTLCLLLAAQLGALPLLDPAWRPLCYALGFSVLLAGSVVCGTRRAIMMSLIYIPALTLVHSVLTLQEGPFSKAPAYLCVIVLFLALTMASGIIHQVTGAHCISEENPAKDSTGTSVRKKGAEETAKAVPPPSAALPVGQAAMGVDRNFLANIALELNNQLTAILGYSQLILKEEIPLLPEKGWVNGIRQAALRMKKSVAHMVSDTGQGPGVLPGLPAQKRSPESSATQPFAQPAIGRRKPRILVVDDEHFICELLEGILGDGFEVKTFANPREALTSLQTNRFDCLLVDLSMPEIPGIEVIKRAKTLHPAMPILVMTGYGRNDPNVAEALRSGANDVIQKPFDNLDELVSMTQKQIVS